MKISKGETSIRFDQVLNKKNGHLCGVKIIRRKNVDFGLLATNQKKKIDYVH